MLIYTNNNLLMYIMDTYYPEIICLVAQIPLTILASIKLLQNIDQFPIKQLGPYSTLSVLLCFLFANITNLIGRIIEHQKGYYIMGSLQPQCRTQHMQLFILGLFYNAFQELPFIIYALKTLRVSICFWRYFNRIDVERISQSVIGLFRNQAYLIYFSIAYVAIMLTLMVCIFGTGTSEYNFYFFQYLCPRQSNIVELIAGILRLVLLSSVFTLSIWTYDSLDFKKYVIIIFFISNLTFIPRLFLYIDSLDRQSICLIRTTYHEIYYSAFVVNLLQTIVTSYYCTKKEQLNPPPMQGVLQSWSSFHNLKLGMIILEDYAIYRDSNTQIKYHERCLESYTFLDQLLKYSRLIEQFKLDDFLEAIQKILQRNDLVKLKLGTMASMLKSKCRDGTLEIKDVKKIQRVLSDFCELVLFEEWKKTSSYYYLKEQFITNGDINQKMDLFDIPLS